MFETKEGVIKPIVYVGIVRNGKILLVNYKEAPNPTKTGWWIPAPGLAFGEDPTEKASELLKDFGFSGKNLKLHGVESFVLPGGWHIINHFVCEVVGEPKHHDNIAEYRWVTKQELEEMKDIAHGKWEIFVGKSLLEQK